MQDCPKFHLFHTGLARSRSLFAMVQHFTDPEDTPFCLLFGTFECQKVLS